MSRYIVIFIALLQSGFTYAQNSNSERKNFEEVLNVSNDEREITWTEMFPNVEPKNFLEATILGLKLGVLLIPVSFLVSYQDLRNINAAIINGCIITLIEIPLYANFLFGVGQLGECLASFKN